MNTDQTRDMLKKYMNAAGQNLALLLDTHGTGLHVLTEAMALFSRSLVPLPAEAACTKGCDWCCHLRVGLSIPEAAVIFSGLTVSATPEGLAYIRNKVIRTAELGNTLDDGWWRTSRTPCPFLDAEQSRTCLIYDLRPFSCRAHHATDVADCRKGFETGRETQIPCFPLYRAVTDMYTTVFIRETAARGLSSFQVELVRSLQILFEKQDAMDEWFQGGDVFRSAGLT